MTIAYDAFSVATAGTGNLSWTHTPVGVPAGIIVLAVQTVSTASSGSATYGGVSMQLVLHVAHNAGSEDGSLDVWFLGGDSILPGAQTVAVTWSFSANHKAVAISLTSAARLVAHTSGGLNNSGTTTPTCTLNITKESFVAAALQSGENAVADITAPSGYTELNNHDWGSDTLSFVKRDALTSTTEVFNWTTTNSEEAGIVAIAVSEATEISGSASNSFGVFTNATSNIKPLDAANSILADGIVDRDVEYNSLAASNQISATQDVRRAIEGSASNSVATTNEAAHGDNPQNSASVSDSVTVTVSKRGKNIVVVGSVATVHGEFNRAASNNATVASEVVGYISEPCSLDEYSPNGSGLPAAPTLSDRGSIRFTYIATNLDLRNPELGDGVKTDPFKVVNRSRGGEFLTYRSSNWGKRRTINIRCVGLTESKKDEIVAFFSLSIGKLIAYIDSENRTWTGIMPTAPVIIDRGQCKYEATFEFRGIPS